MKYLRIMAIGLVVLLEMFFYQAKIADAKELEANRTYSIDLDGDGKKENVMWKSTNINFDMRNDQVKIFVNGKKKRVVSGYYHGRVTLEDINKRDRYKELIVHFYGDNDRVENAYAFRYEKTGFHQIFSTGFNFYIGHQKGDGKVYCTQEYYDSNLQQGGIIVKYKIKSDKLVPLKNKTISLESYSAKRKYTASKNLSVQKSIKNSRTKFKIKKGEVFYITKFRLNVNLNEVFDGDGKKFSFFYVKTKSGKKGWVKNQYNDFFYENYTAA